MAWDYAAQIHALTGFDADSTDVSEEGTETFRVLSKQWLTDAAREVLNLFSYFFKSFSMRFRKACTFFHI